MTQKNETKGKLAKAQRLLKYTSILALVALILFISLIIKPDLTFDQKALDNTLYDQQDINSIENGIHISTGFIAKEGYTQTDLDDLKEKVEVLPTPEIISLGNFFMNQFESLRNGTSKNWFKVEKKTTATQKRALMKSVKILVI